MGTFTSSTIRGLSSLVVVALLAGCGGGGGSGGSGGGSALVYSGNSNAAIITGSNSARLVTAIFGSGETAVIAGGTSIEGSGSVRSGSGGLIDLARLLNRASSDLLARSEQARATQRTVQGVIPIDVIQPCDSGAVRIFGNLEDDRTGTLSVSYDNCLQGTETLNGQATLRIDLFDAGISKVTDHTLDIASLAIRGPGVSQDVSGSRRVRLSGAGGNVETITENVTQRNNLTGKMTRTENFVTVNVYASLSGPSSVTQTVSGRVFVSVDGFIDVSTSVPLFFSALDQPFPDIGQILLVGSTNRAIRVTARSAVMVTLELDLDGNGLFEGVAILKWSELSTPIGADLADSDGDGMHNSWETANGLNMNDPADALLDRDGDGVSNFAEYRAGTDPRSLASFSPDIAIRITASDLIYDPGTQRIYAAVSTSPGSVIPINPVTGLAGTPIPVGHNPVKLARSDNGQYLYVALDGQNDVQRVNLATQTVDLTFSIGSDPFLGPRFAEDIEVLPGAPQSVAVSRKYKGFSPRHAGVAIYDNGVQRPTTTPTHTGSNVIEFSASAGLLYGYNQETTDFGFRRMTVNSSGVTVQDVTPNLVQFFGVNILFHAGWIYTNIGNVINPDTATLAGSFPVPVSNTNLVAADATVGRVFYLTGDKTLRAFDLTTRQQLGAVAINFEGAPGSLIRWGPKGLAFRTSTGRVHLVEFASLIP
jgi:thrombospondin type 3 repeat protein